MIEALKDWMFGIVGASFLAAAAKTLTPDGKAKRIVVLVCGVVVIMAFLSFSGSIDMLKFSENLASYKNEAQELTENLNNENDRLNRTIIEESAASYILDKGSELGMSISESKVSAKWSESGYWFPVSAEIRGVYTENQKTQLSYYMESELGIPEENQSWCTDE